MDRVELGGHYRSMKCSRLSLRGTRTCRPRARERCHGGNSIPKMTTGERSARWSNEDVAGAVEQIVVARPSKQWSDCDAGVNAARRSMRDVRYVDAAPSSRELNASSKHREQSRCGRV